MSFGLINFWIPLVLLIQFYYLIPSKRGRNVLLLSAGLLGYALIDYRFLFCLLLSTLTDFIAGFLVIPKNKKIIRFIALFFSLFINLGLLCLFKYLPDLSSSQNYFTIFIKSIGLPLGISFYTFQTISYTLDCWKGKIRPTSDIISFSLYVSFFPQLAAGPIEQAHRLLPQFQKKLTKLNIYKFKEGFYLILLGLFKKVYVAGAVIHPLKRIYESPDPPASLALLSGALAVLHVYLDFSAYSDLARGIAKFFGIELMVNFKPFLFSKNIKEFWGRWHISLQLWIKNYVLPVFIFLKSSPLKKFLFPFLVFIPFSLWHAVNLNWLLFGLFNAIFFIAYSFFSKTTIWFLIPGFIKYLLSFCFMFLLHSINGWLYYSPDFETVLRLIQRLPEFKGFGRETFDLIFYLFPFLAPVLTYEWFQNKYDTELFIMKAPFLIRAFWIAVALAGIFIFERNTEHSFVYFGF